MRRTVALLALTTLTLAACGGSDTATDVGDDVDAADVDAAGVDAADDPQFDVPATAGGEGGSAGGGPIVEVFGTTPAGPVDGFVLWDGGCEVEGSIDAPSFEQADAWVPADWQVIGSGSGFLVTLGGAEKSFSVGTSQQQPGTPVADILAGNFGGAPFEEVAQLSWGGATLPLGFDGSVYRFVAPAATIRGGGLEFDIAFEATFGSTGTGDIAAFDQSDVIAAFESLSLEACAIEAETAPLLNREVRIVD